MNTSTSDLARCCSEETQKFLKQKPSNDDFCLALFRRAIMMRDEHAWYCIYTQYAPLVLTWVTQHQAVAPIVDQEGTSPLVNASFAKFANAVTPDKMENFSSLSGILKYLKMCVHSVVADELRVRQTHQYEDTLELMEYEPAAPCPADDVIAHMSAQGVWDVVQEELKKDEERVMAYLICIQQMKPIEICRQYPKFFPSVDEVYRVKRNVLERLRRNQRLQVMFLQTISPAKRTA